MPGKSRNNTDFFSQVYEVTRLIPWGRVTSYGAIARYLGTGRSARTVGWALNASHAGGEFVPTVSVLELFMPAPLKVLADFHKSFSPF